eukprot:CAMPEP_0197032698 /NCGR_PEP_ID=MMETSP1384-20130603/11309_1 /TAXON_ID=29189 /ORGANISM="Ammonia sp." /LENGTH=355 /DNA_ID=CAMNT_0042462395 /DNA_START=9 /DNA_END=1076 /DNA_ORIENTATION=-
MSATAVMFVTFVLFQNSVVNVQSVTPYPASTCSGTNASTPASSSTTGTRSMLIENHAFTSEWWVAFFLLDVDESCNVSIVNVAITDDNYYQGEWVSFDPAGLQHNHYSFLHQNARFTPPFSVRITSRSPGNTTQVLYACDLITDFQPRSQFVFGANLCAPNNTKLPLIASTQAWWTTFTGSTTLSRAEPDERPVAIVVISAASILCVLVVVIVLYVHCCRRESQIESAVSDVPAALEKRKTDEAELEMVLKHGQKSITATEPGRIVHDDEKKDIDDQLEIERVETRNEGEVREDDGASEVIRAGSSMYNGDVTDAEKTNRGTATKGILTKTAKPPEISNSDDDLYEENLETPENV